MFTVKLIFERQWLHALCLALLLAGMLSASHLNVMAAGTFGGIRTGLWFWTAIGLAIAHQVFVWFCWRIQLHGGWLDRIFGAYAFPSYAFIFFALGSSRVLAVFVLAISNRDTVPVDVTFLRILAVALLLPAIYLLYSVIRYFSFKRAFGADHFDEKYRRFPLVNKGIFRFTRNGMYVFGFLFLWVPALWCASMAALCAALFNHLYIWVHYFATEQPDMKRIYGDVQPENKN